MLKAFLLLMIPLMLQAQTGSSVIFGTVTDSSGAALASASVSATSEATGVMEKVNTNEAGNYVFPDLRSGSYKITCAKGGFQTVERTGILIQVDQRARVDLTMQVGEVKQVMEVQGTVTTVDTFSSTVKDVVDSNLMDVLPLNGRNALSLLVFSVNGSRANQSAYILDGGLNMDMYNNVPAAFPNPDTLDIRRQPNRHLAFATGIHICAGNSLARMEARVAIGRMARRFATIERDGDAVRSRRARFRGFLKYPVRVR